MSAAADIEFVGTPDRVLDALDAAPVCRLKASPNASGAGFHGRGASVQYLAQTLKLSDSAIRVAIHRLRVEGLVRVYTARTDGCRRIFVTGEATR